MTASNRKMSVQYRPLQRQIQGRRQPDKRGTVRGGGVLQYLDALRLQLLKHLIAAEVLVGPVGGAEEGKEHIQILPGLLWREIVHHIAAGHQSLHLPVGEGVVLAGKVRRPGGDVQGLPLLDDGPALLVDRVQKGVEVHRRGRGGCGLGGGFRRGGAPRQQGEAQGQGEQPPVHSSTLPFSPSR